MQSLPTQPRPVPIPVLENPRHGAFAQARARGAVLNDAYEDAGFAPDRSHASRLAGREDVAERIAELKAEQAGLDGASPHKAIAALLDAERLLGELALSRQIDRMGWRMGRKI
jgi:hypothetical protein